MGPSNPKLHEELKPLTNEATTAITELCAPNTLSHITCPETPRWLSLHPFKSVPTQYSWEHELEAEIEEAVFSDEESDPSHSPFSFHSITEEDRGRSRKRAWSPDSEELPAFEKASCRVLAVLRCYVYNLEHGMLVTGSKVDERVESALLRLIGKLEGGSCGGEKGDEMRESWEISDEERVVLEIEDYGIEVRRLREVLPEEVQKVVKEILKCTRVRGTVNGKEDMTSSKESFEFIEC